MKTILALLALTFPLAAHAADAKPDALAHGKGADFTGGAKDLYGSTVDGEEVNYVYAQPTGVHASMQMKFTVSLAPAISVTVAVIWPSWGGTPGGV